MPFVRTLTGFAPPPRTDGVAFVTAFIEEAAASTGPWVRIDTKAITPVDANPADPALRSFTTGLATLDPTAWYRIVWRDSAGSDFTGDPVLFPSPAGLYATPAELRADLGLTATDLTDTAANTLLERASDLIDTMLGVRPADEITGRKVDRGDVETWQWARLNRATRVLAGDMQRAPDAYSTAQAESVSGPEFSISGRRGGGGGAVGAQVAALLDSSGLRQRWARLSSR